MLTVNYDVKMGEIKLVQKSDGKKITLTICGCNAICAFMNFYKDKDGVDMVQLCGFLSNTEHIRNLLKDKVDIFEWDIVKKVRLNMYYPDNKYVLNYLTKVGHKVECYYQEPKQKGK